MTPRSVTLVIPARDASETIDACLEAVDRVRQREGSRLERIIVVDDGSRDDTLERVRRHDVEILESGGRGAGAARNLGWRHATTPLVWFVDSDCEAEPEALAEVAWWLSTLPLCPGVPFRRPEYTVELAVLASDASDSAAGSILVRVGENPLRGRSVFPPIVAQASSTARELWALLDSLLGHAQWIRGRALAVVLDNMRAAELLRGAHTSRAHLHQRHHQILLGRLHGCGHGGGGRRLLRS